MGVYRGIVQYDYNLYLGGLVSALEGTFTSVTVLVNLMQWTFGQLLAFSSEG